MNIFGIKIERNNKYDSLRRKQQGRFAATVKEYSGDSYSQEFSSFKSIQGERSLDYDLIDGLYDATILNRIINKIVSDAVSDFYTIQITDIKGQRIPDLEDQCRMYHSNLSTQILKDIFRDILKYGSCATFIGEMEGEVLAKPFNLKLNNLKAEIKDGEVSVWKYNDGIEDMELNVEDVMFFGNDIATGEVFGKSFLGPIIHTLHLFLNTELNLSEIVDKFVLPILAWVVKGDGEISDKKLMDLATSITKNYEQGTDIIIGEDVESQVIGANQSQFDLVPILHELKETLGIMTVPFQILGGKADNLSSSTVQFKTYLRTVRNYQAIISEGLVNFLYKPYLESLGKVVGVDIGNIYINFPMVSIETPAESAVWVFQALREGLISREEARGVFGYSGLPLDPEDIIVMTDSNNSGTKNDSNGDPANKNGTGDPKNKQE